jgi:glutamate racemase
MLAEDIARLHNSELPIGIFDSGVGGLTVVRQIRRTLPHEDIVYLGDTARVPYGTKSPSTIVRFSDEDIEFLLHQQVKAVVVGCSTVSAWALPTLIKKYDLPIWGVIMPGVETALSVTRNNRIGVIGTNATIRSMCYNRSIKARRPGARVFAQACPLLVPLVEEGWMNHRVTHIILEEYLQPLLRQRIDTLILACTHFPLLKSAIRRIVGKSATLVDSAERCAIYARESLEQNGLLCKKRRRHGRLEAFVTDETQRFTSLAQRFLGEPLHSALKVVLPAS